MPDTLKIKVEVTYTPSTVTAVNKPFAEKPDTLTVTMTGTDFVVDTQDIGTSDEAITKGEIGTLGWCLIYNLDATNYVEIGLTSSYTVKLLAGQYCLFPAAAALFGKANTATVKIKKVFFEL